MAAVMSWRCAVPLDDPHKYLSENATQLPPGYKTHDALAQYENSVPTAVRRAAARADELAHEGVGQDQASDIDAASRRWAARRPNVWWFIHVSPKRRHRKTGDIRGRHANNDAGMAKAVYRLIAARGMDKMQAECAVAWSLVGAANISLKAARARIRTALRRLG
jgi:hypothetical protein